MTDFEKPEWRIWVGGQQSYKSRVGLGQGIYAFAFNHVQQLQRWTARSLLADLPFLNRRHTGVEDRGEHRLTHLGPAANGPNLLGRKFAYRGQTKGIQFSQRMLIDRANSSEAESGLVHFI